MIVNSCLNVRTAAPEDVPEIHALLEPYADAKIVLRRSQEDILQYIGNFVVAEIDGKICGCGAARDFGGSLYEVRSLVVNKSIQKKGIGRAIVTFFVNRLKDRGEKGWRLFALTMSPGFFLSLGFKEVSKEMFPEKIWADCLKCSKYNCCDEIAVLLEADQEK